MSPQICLGTAQFGLAYGITNSKGKIDTKEAKKMLDKAAQFGTGLPDTAQAYGNAETVLGQSFKSENSYKLISKLPVQSKSEFLEEDKVIWEKAYIRVADA